MTKPETTKTLGQLHFEDLAPQRFEDLVRDLIYDFKDWKDIQAVGRAGNDSGNDIIAYEKLETRSSEINDSNDEEQTFLGNRWMIQAKRYSKLTPKEIKIILEDININDPPYGYILAVTSNVSKKSQEVFAKILREKGVVEFHMWGKSELEAFLYLPKHDRILFTFFGISLIFKKRALKMSVRAKISVKNKLFSCLGKRNNIITDILIRDIKDLNYPADEACKDFSKSPPWKKYSVIEQHPLGLICRSKKFFAYYNKAENRWSYTDALNLFSQDNLSEQLALLKAKEKRDLIHDFYDYLPFYQKAFYCKNALVRYEDIILVDEEGDLLFDMPHVYVDFSNETGPFYGFHSYLLTDCGELHDLDELENIEFFPKSFSAKKFGNQYEDRHIKLENLSRRSVFDEQLNSGIIFDFNGNYDYLEPSDLINLEINDEHFKNHVIQITNKYKKSLKDCNSIFSESHFSYHFNSQLDKAKNLNKKILILEFRNKHNFGG